MSGVNGINNNLTTQAVIAPTKPEAAKAPVAGKTDNSSNPPYVVDLTVTAVVKSRKLQGQTTEQISSSMGIDAKTVDSHLSTKPAEPEFMTAPAQIPPKPVESASSASAPPPTQPSPPPAPVQAKSFLATPDNTPDPVSGSAAANGTSGMPSVPAPLAPPPSYTAQASNNSSPPSAAKAFGIVN